MTAKFSATDAAGTVHTRTSKTRSYTHTVVVLPSYSFDMARAEAKDWAKSDGSNFDYYAAIAAGNDPHPTINYRAQSPDKWSAEEIAAGEAYAVAENAKRLADAKEKVDGVTRGEYLRIKQVERVSAVHRRKAEGYYKVWQNLGWCGRYDLAGKLAAQAAGGRYAQVAILEAKEAGR